MSPTVGHNETMSWQIRPATSEDAEALAACIDAAYAADRARIENLPDFSEGISAYIENNVVWIAEAGDRILGGVFLILRDTFGQLANIAVHPDSAGMGLGRALMERAEDSCRQRGLVEMRLTTHVEMPGNVRLYEHLGWRKTGKVGNKVHMAKTLT